jgi:hypothetical protein
VAGTGVGFNDKEIDGCGRREYFEMLPSGKHEACTVALTQVTLGNVQIVQERAIVGMMLGEEANEANKFGTKRQ